VAEIDDLREQKEKYESAPIFTPVTVPSPKNDPCIVVCAI